VTPPVVAAAHDAVAAATDSLRAAGCDTPRLDAEVLVAAAAGLDRLELLARPDLGLEPAASRTAMEWIRRRARREPVAYIVGRAPFRRIELAVDRRVLIPRPDTELLVEVAAELAPEGGAVHDVGTGSGAIALALKDERPDLTVTASDRSAGAVEVARANAARLGLDVAVGQAAGLPRDAPAAAALPSASAPAPALPPPPASAAAPRRWDLVVANLPYVREDEWAGLQPEIRDHEPREALVAGADGLDEIRALVAQAPPGTLLALEHAPGQAAAVRALLGGAETRRDLAGRERVTIGRGPEAEGAAVAIGRGL
jgi:release factor glutamine methyltransferase